MSDFSDLSKWHVEHDRQILATSTEVDEKRLRGIVDHMRMRAEVDTPTPVTIGDESITVGYVRHPRIGRNELGFVIIADLWLQGCMPLSAEVGRGIGQVRLLPRVE